VVHTLMKQDMIPWQYTPVQGYIQASETTLKAEAKAFAGSRAVAKQVRIKTLQCLVCAVCLQRSCCFTDSQHVQRFFAHILCPQLRSLWQQHPKPRQQPII